VNPTLHSIQDNKEILSNRMTTKDKFVTGIMLTLLVWGDQVVGLWWGWVQYVSSFL